MKAKLQPWAEMLLPRLFGEEMISFQKYFSKPKSRTKIKIEEKSSGREGTFAQVWWQSYSGRKKHQRPTLWQGAEGQTFETVGSKPKSNQANSAG